LLTANILRERQTVKSNWRTFSRRTVVTLSVIGLLLIGLRAALPYLVERYVNQVLNEIPGYHGQVGSVSLDLWRGAYEIQNVKLEKLNSDIPVPFFEAKTIDLMIEWREIIHGALVGQITLLEPKLNYVVGPTAQSSQNQINSSWQQSVEELFPLRINQLQIENGEVHFRDFHSTPKVNIFLDHLEATATNLKNTRERGENLFATIDAIGQPMKGASVQLHAKLDALARQPTFDLNGELHDMPLQDLNNLFMAYGGFEMSGGHLDVFTQLVARNGNITGYVKPILKNASVKIWSGHESNPVQYLWEPLVTLLSQMLKNWPHDQFATKIPISGTFDDPRLNSWAAVFGLIKNAWIQALHPGMEGVQKPPNAAKEDKDQPPTTLIRAVPGKVS
jgi:hypothetical protein